MATMVSPIRITMAAALPKKMALPRCSGFRLRAAIAMTTALSPDRTMLARMMEPNALQNVADEKSSPNMATPNVMNAKAPGKGAFVGFGAV